MLSSAVSSKSQRTVVGNCFPEKASSFTVFFITTELCNPFETNNLRNLSICMFVVEIVYSLRQRVEKHFVRKPLCSCQVFFITCHLVCIGKHFVHAAMFNIEHRLHLFFREL